MSAILKVKDLSVGYGTSEVLNSVSFTLDKGDYVALAGPNGSGKTTLIKTILGLMEIRSGQIELFGATAGSFHQWDLIGYLPQRVNVFNPLFPATVREAVSLGLLSRKRFPKIFSRSDEARIDDTMELMGITDIKNRLVGELSGGQQQRTFLARALVSSPELLILDEPSTALDPQARENFFELIKTLNHERGITIILITHDISQIGQYANRLLYLDKTVIFYGLFSEFCQSEEMNRFFGHFSQHMICQQHH